MEELPKWASDIVESIAAASARPSVHDQRGRSVWPLFVDAALVGAFVPRDLCVGFLSGSERKAAEREVLRFAEVTPQLEGTRWLLTREARHAVLSDINANEIADAASRTSARFHDPLTVALRDCVQGSPSRDLESMTTEELEATRLAVTWLRGLANLDLPQLEDLDRRIALQRLLAPFERMIGKVDGGKDRFFGREVEREDLRAYVGVVAADSVGTAIKRAARNIARALVGRKPKVVWGSGGVGKTTLIAKFMLEHARTSTRFPFAYLDFDRSTVSARNRAGLLAEMCRQVAAQFESLTGPMTMLQDQVTAIARRIDVTTEADSITALLPYAQAFRDLIDRQFSSSSIPFLLVFDTFEIVQYGPDQVIGLEKLVSTFAGGDVSKWSRLRLIISGRQAVPRFLGGVEELKLGALDLDGSAKMLAVLAADGGKTISKDEALRLVDAIAKHVRDKSNNGVRPLRLRLIGELFSEGDEDGATVVQTLLEDLANPTNSNAVGRALVDGILVRRILNHVKDPRVRALADPGLVVRTITEDVIEKVMTRSTPQPTGDGDWEGDPEVIVNPWIVDEATAKEIFEAFAHELSLVDREGRALRHRQDVRQDMLPLIKAHRPNGFARVHQLAYDYFRANALADATDTCFAAEAIYHGLWLERPIDEIDHLWPKGTAFDPRIDPEEFLAESLQNLYLRAKKRAPLTPQEIRRLPTPIAADWLAARCEQMLPQQRLDAIVAEIRAAGGEEFAAFDNYRAVAAIAARVLYRAGLWADTALLLKRHLDACFAKPRKGESVSMIRLWATVLAKSGAEPEQLARLLSLVPATGDPLVRTEICAHICLGLEDVPERKRIRDASGELAIDASHDIRSSAWSRELRILRLVLATRKNGSQRFVHEYLNRCERLPHDDTVIDIVSRWRGGRVDERTLDDLWSNNRAALQKNAETSDIVAIATADHSDWVVPFGNALTRDFEKHRRAIEKATRGIAPVEVAPHVESAVKTRDGNLLLELVAERGMLRIAQQIHASRSERSYPQDAADLADLLLRWHRITTGELVEEVVELRSVADLLTSADWTQLVPRLVLFAADEASRVWPRDAFNVLDPHQIVRETVQTILEGASKAEAGPLFQIIAAQVEATVARHSVDDFLELVAQIDWEVVVPRLLAYANARLRRHGRAANAYGLLPDDCVQEAVRRFIDQSRKYEPSLRTSVFAFLCSVIDSLISHEAAQKWRRGSHLTIGEDADDEVREYLLPSGEDFTDELFANDDLEQFLSSLEPDLARFAQVVAEHIDATTDDLAGMLSTTVENVRNLQKRLRRRRKNWPPR